MRPATTTPSCSIGRRNQQAALPQVQRLLDKEPRNPGYLNLKAAILANLGDYADSIKVYESGIARVSAAAEGLDELWPCA